MKGLSFMKKLLFIIASCLSAFSVYAEDEEKVVTLEEFYSQSAGIFAEEAKKARPESIQTPRASNPKQSVKRRLITRARQPRAYRYWRDVQTRQHNETLWHSIEE